MSLLALCQRRSLVLQISAATDQAGLNWRVLLAQSDGIEKRVATELPRFTLITPDYLADKTLLTRIRLASPQTFIVLCLPPETNPNSALWEWLDELDFDVLCTLDELAECLQTLKAGRFFRSSLLPNAASRGKSPMLPGWQELTQAERRVLRKVAEGKTGPQIADELCLSEKTVNNHKLKIGQKLQANGGPGSLNRFVLTHRDTILGLLI